VLPTNQSWIAGVYLCILSKGLSQTGKLAKIQCWTCLLSFAALRFCTTPPEITVEIRLEIKWALEWEIKIARPHGQAVTESDTGADTRIG